MNRPILGEPIQVEVSDEEDGRISEMIDQAERDIEAMRPILRWEKTREEVVKRAAALYGVPYLTYLREAAFRQAVADLKAAADVCPEVVASKEDDQARGVQAG